jgi:branched-chain amino acid transport system substrate-binding protein
MIHPHRFFTHLRGLAAAAALLGCTLAHAEITIGVSVTQTGPASALGIPSRNALALFPTEIAGEKIKLVILDDASDPSGATRNARRLIDDHADVLIGSTTAPTALAVAEVAFETKTPQLASAPIELPENRNAWTFRLPQAVPLMAEGVVEHFARQGVKTVGFLGYTDSYGETWLRDMTRFMQAAGMRMVVTERFSRADTSVVSQALKVAAANPDAVLIVASGAGAAMPQLALNDRGYKGKIYQTYAAVAPDIIRVGGKGIEGGFGVSGPAALPTELPENHPSRKVALEFVQAYEAKYGVGTYNQFAANIWGGWLLLERALPMALKKAKPGTPEFRAALRDALESTHELVVPQGVVNYTATDHFGFDARGRFMLQVKNGAWKAVH